MRPATTVHSYVGIQVEVTLVNVNLAIYLTTLFGVAKKVISVLNSLSLHNPIDTFVYRIVRETYYYQFISFSFERLPLTRLFASYLSNYLCLL